MNSTSEQEVRVRIVDRSDPRLAGARVLIVGVGGLGTPAAEALAAAGVGTLVLLDPDVVEVSNLHRQILHRTSSIGRPKVDSASATLAARYPDVHIEAMRARLTADNLDDLFRQASFVIDATDGAATKYLINDGAIRRGVPYSHAGVVGLQGQTLTVLPGRSACLRCIFPEAPAADEGGGCQDEGILGPIAGVIGSLQAGEAIRYLLGDVPAFAGRLLTYDARVPRWRVVPLDRAAHCPACALCLPVAASPEATISSHGS